MYRGELVRFKEALRSAPIPKRNICRQNCLNHRHLMHCRNSMAQTRVQSWVHKPCDDLLVHRLQNERLRNRGQDWLLLRLKRDDWFGYPTRINDMLS
jgi:hypothetical protein